MLLFVVASVVCCFDLKCTIPIFLLPYDVFSMSVARAGAVDAISAIAAVVSSVLVFIVRFLSLDSSIKHISLYKIKF